MELVCHSDTRETCRIITGENVFETLSELTELYFSNNETVFILVDSNTRNFCLPYLLSKVTSLINSVILETHPGEQSKTFENTGSLLGKMISSGAGRGSLMINLGGGMISDLGGFAASLFKRGISFINIPTTLMGMVDAAVGGKTGVNNDGSKNQTGTFRMPAAVFICTGFLKTLPFDQLKSGYAEMLKYGLIADENLWENLKDASDFTGFIDQCLKIKIFIVNEDYREEDQRVLLNFGHTIGHALESLSMMPGRTPVTHGHAVAAGMIIESYISVFLAGLDQHHFEEIKSMIGAHFPMIPYSIDDIGIMKTFIQKDKKMTGHEIRMALLEKPGKAVCGISVPASILDQALGVFAVEKI